MTFLAFLTLFGPSLDEPIEFKPFVGTAPSVVAKLALQSGLKLTTGKNVANDVIAISVPKATMRQIMDNIAYTIQAEWKEAGGEWTLVRSEEQIKAQNALDRATTIDQIKKAVEKLPKDEAWTEADAKGIALQVDTFDRRANRFDLGTGFSDLNNKMPGRRLLNRFLRSISPEVLADVAFVGRTVFSTNPNKMQKALPISMKGAVDQFVKENNLLSSAWTSGTDEERPSIFEKPNTLKTIEEIHVNMRRSSLNGISIDLHAYDSEGMDTTLNTSHSFQLDLSNDFFKPGKVAPEDKVVELSPLSKKVLESAAQSMNGLPFNPPQDVRQYLLHPKANEPLGLINTEAVWVMAESEKKPVIIALPEMEFFLIMAMAQDGKVTLKRYMSSLDMCALIRDEADGWVRYRDSMPVLNRIRRVDRQAFDDYFRRIEKDKRTSLDGFAQFVVNYPGRLENTMFPIFLMITGSYPANFQFDDDLSMVRLYGTLSSPQKDALRKGVKLKISDFSAAQQAILNTFIFGSHMRSRSYHYEGNGAAMGKGLHKSILNEPTEAFPNGLSEPFELSAAVTDQASWFRQESWGEIRPVDASGAAWDVFQLERLDLFPYANTAQFREKGGFAQGQSVIWTFQVKLNNFSTTEVQLTDHTFPEGNFIPFKDLPKDFLADIDKSLVQLREQYKNTKPGEFGGGRGAPPPRR